IDCTTILNCGYHHYSTRRSSDHGGARRGRTVAHAVDEQDGVARLGAADEDIAAFTAPPVGGHLHACGAHQHFGEGLAGHLLDVEIGRAAWREPAVVRLLAWEYAG